MVEFVGDDDGYSVSACRRLYILQGLQKHSTPIIKYQQTSYGGMIFQEPLGTLGTLIFLVWGFIPFCVMISDAAFPDREAIVQTKGKML